MTTNTDLIAELRSPDVFNRAVMLRAADALEAAEVEIARLSTLAEGRAALGLAGIALAEAIGTVAVERSRIDYLRPYVERAEVAEEGLFRVVQELGFDTDGAQSAGEFFGPLSARRQDETWATSAPDIALLYAKEYREDAEREAEALEAKRDAAAQRAEVAEAQAKELFAENYEMAQTIARLKRGEGR